jgi:hypothetical protein
MVALESLPAQRLLSARADRAAPLLPLLSRFLDLQKGHRRLSRRVNLTVNWHAPRIAAARLLELQAISWPFLASFAHFDALARFCSSHRCPSASVKDRRPE